MRRYEDVVLAITETVEVIKMSTVIHNTNNYCNYFTANVI